MVEVERTIGKNISLYPRHIDAVKRYAGFKKYKGESEAYQYIIDDFFNSELKEVRHRFILYVIVPLIFCVFSTVVNIATDRVTSIVFEKGLYFPELYILSKFFLVLSFLSISVFIAGVYLFRYRTHKSSEEEINVDKDT